VQELVTRKSNNRVEADPAIRRHDCIRAQAGEEGRSSAPGLLPDRKPLFRGSKSIDILRRCSLLPTRHIHADVAWEVVRSRLRLAASMLRILKRCAMTAWGDGRSNETHWASRYRHQDAWSNRNEKLAREGAVLPLVPSPTPTRGQYLRRVLGSTNAKRSIRMRETGTRMQTCE